jgi:hypothetical protein
MGRAAAFSPFVQYFLLFPCVEPCRRVGGPKKGVLCRVLAVELVELVLLLPLYCCCCTMFSCTLDSILQKSMALACSERLGRLNSTGASRQSASH